MREMTDEEATQLMLEQTLIAETAGGPDMLFSCGVWHCGHIKDGIHVSVPPDSPGWVMTFEDLEKIYLKAKKIRVSKQGE